MKLSDWARKQGVSYLTAWRWFKAGKLPVPARQLPSGTILVEEPRAQGRTVLYTRVSGPHQKADLERQVERLLAWAKAQGLGDYQVVAEVGSASRRRGKLLALLRDPDVARIVVLRKEALTAFAWPLLEAALQGCGRRLEVLE
ncbi:recombinase family protein [Thermus caldilimi]|uniref:recombinase family protein n=1 Tax=Thermus caldilimi TaxID=2483360 RepID=UPI0010766D62|nr:recombinase family protein [Thermus caldilimi]